MTSGFHSNELLKSLSNYPVAKGDVEGHEFHGNQYVSAGNQADEAQKIVGYVKDAGYNTDHFAVEQSHRDIARALEETSKGLVGNPKLKTAFDKASKAHREAAAAHTEAMFDMSKVSGAISASEKALQASQNADRLNYA